ncbi:hypothetical protein HYU21_04510, partial [Candidatus Woesearchaeota archaeon]|nr:hypothetical protein [Candidatus Woesearchaeota archaeon]
SCKGGITTPVIKTPAQTPVQQQYAPVQTQPKPVQTTQPTVQKLTLAQVWTNYKSLFILGPVSLILLIVVIILFLHHFQHKKVAYNYDELKTWIAQEKKMGTSNDDIKQILAQNTGWKKKEVEEMFTGLENPLVKK